MSDTLKNASFEVAKNAAPDVKKNGTDTSKVFKTTEELVKDQYKKGSK